MPRPPQGPKVPVSVRGANDDHGLLTRATPCTEHDKFQMTKITYSKRCRPVSSHDFTAREPCSSRKEFSRRSHRSVSCLMATQWLSYMHDAARDVCMQIIL